MLKKLNWIFVLFVLVISVNFVSAGLTDNLVSYWKFDETSGTTLNDSLNTNNGGDINATQGASGKINFL